MAVGSLARRDADSRGDPAPPEQVGGSGRRFLNRRLRRPQYILGWLCLLVLVVTALLANVLSPFDPTLQNVSLRLHPPDLGSAHPLGTDALGRDLLSRVLYGARISLTVGLVATLFAAALGGALGLIAGYWPGKIATVIMGVADAQLAFPYILLALVFVATLGSSLGNVIIVLALTNWIVFARTVYSLTLSLRAREFVHASISLGASSVRVLGRHLLPHVVPTIIVLATLQVGQMILFESALSFLGMGVPAETPTWGAMLSDSRNYMQSAPWLSIFPGTAIMLTVLSVTMVGDWLSELLDPRGQRQT